jgi:hypothetical protein
MDQIYSTRRDGGAGHMNVLNVQKHHMASALHYFGLAIVSNRGPHALWKLVTIDRTANVKSLLP